MTDTDKSMKITIRPDTCTGHARCQMICPEVFGSDDLGYVELKLPDAPRELRASVLEAASSCPEGAIEVVDVF